MVKNKIVEQPPKLQISKTEVFAIFFGALIFGISLSYKSFSNSLLEGFVKFFTFFMASFLPAIWIFLFKNFLKNRKKFIFL